METKHAAGPRRISELTGSQSVRRGRPRHLWTWKLYSNLCPSHQKRCLAVADWKVLSGMTKYRKGPQRVAASSCNVLSGC